MAKIEDCSKEIAELEKVIKICRKNKELFCKEKEMLSYEQARCSLIYAQIHGVLAPQNNQKAQDDIRNLCWSVIQNDILICESKVQKFTEIKDKLKNEILVAEKQKNKTPEREEYLKQLKKKEDVCYKYLGEWLVLHENFYALAAFRSLEHFALFMEWDTHESQKVWKHSLDPYNDGGRTGVNKPFFTYFNRMVTKKDIKFISKQYPTGVGKSYGNQIAISWVLGINKDNDILLVLGNPTLVSNNTKGICEIMTKTRFAKVFPEFQKYHDMGGNVVGNMFSICRIKDGELCLEGSSRNMNLKVISKQTPVDGIRVRFLFLDDVCRSKDANNLTQHTKDIDDFWNSWYKRNYGTDDFYIVACGTAYSVEDILSHLIRYYSKGKMYRTSFNKYTYESEDKSCVFIKIPKIDDQLNRSTYPQKFPYEEAVKARERNYAMFMAMEQQEPQNPETSPLSWDKILTYDKLPSGLSEYSQAVLDPARSGKNYVTMGIHRVKTEIDKTGAEIKRHYLVDCLFELKKMEDVYDMIVDKIIRHHIVRLDVETNTDTSLPNLLTKMLHERGITFCKIDGFYSFENKKSKIDEIVYSCEGVFVNQMVYPAFGMYAPSHPMGKFMQYITCYDYKQKMEYDDSIDEECMYIERFVLGEKQSEQPVLLYV